MFQLDLLIDTTVLPLNIMSLRDDKFIDFVKGEAGDGAAALLEIQGINSVKSLLMTPNIYSVMDMKSKSLDAFKNKYGYGNSLECPSENVLGRNVLLFFVLSVVYVCKDEKQKDISSEDIFRRTFSTVFVYRPFSNERN